MAFENVEVYVRYADYQYEGQELRFATIDENQAFSYFNDDVDRMTDAPYAPDDSLENVSVFVNGKYVETWQRDRGEWVKNKYSKNREVRNVIKIE